MRQRTTQPPRARRLRDACAGWPFKLVFVMRALTQLEGRFAQLHRRNLIQQQQRRWRDIGRRDQPQHRHPLAARREAINVGVLGVLGVLDAVAQ